MANGRKNLTEANSGKPLEKLRLLVRKYAPMSLKSWLVFIAAMGVAAAVCAMLRRVSTSDVHVPMIFVLAVLVIALFTEGYFYGVLAAFVSVICVNWAFTYPYLKLDFSVYGYPLTFMTMLAVGVAVSTLISRVKDQQEIEVEVAAERTRANLLRAVSHDLRTPLTTISGSISAVLDSGESLSAEQKRQLLADANHDAEWLCRMVENLLSITRINDGSIQRINKEPEMLEEVLGEAVGNFKKRTPGIRVEVCVPDEALFVPMDAMLIEQVLFNLLDNAVQHGGELSCIHILARREKSFVSVTVRDDGRGISKSALGHIFDGYQALGGSGDADKSRRMGIGLTVCRTIVEAHGGTINAKNAEEGGAEFTFTLPLEEVLDDDKG